MKYKDTYAVDLDGVLAKWTPGKWHGIEHIGTPIMPMVERVRKWLSEGKRVKIFTARANNPDAIPPIRAWCKEHIGIELPVTNKKEPIFSKFFDDRAEKVERNTGRILSSNARKKARKMAV